MNDKHQLISLIVPVYNAAPWLNDFFASVEAQTYAPFELILVDDGSTDGSRAMCERFCSQLPESRRLIVRGNGGSGAARNSGLDDAGGDLVAFADSDDVLHPSYLHRLWEVKSRSGADIAMVHFSESSSTCMRKGVRIATLSPRQALVDTLYQRGLDTSVCCKLFDRRLFDLHRFDETILYEDLELMVRLLPAVRFVANAPDDVLYFYRRHSGSNIGSWNARRLEVMDITRTIVERYANDAELLRASSDRHFSASFNMFLLLAANGHRADSPCANECWQVITANRLTTLRDPRVRLRNKLGAVLSLCGRKFTVLFARFVR